MENQERSLFTRMQPSRDSIRLQMGRKGFEAGKVTSTTESSKQCQIGERHSTKEHISPTSSGKYVATPRPTMDNLKQWELVECGHNLRVVEKRILKPLEQISGMDIERISCFPGKKTLPENVAIDANLEEKLKAFKDSKIVQPIMAPQQESTDDAKVPINLELILKQRKGSAIESTDMLQRLEQQVKAIEMDTLATRMRQLEFSSDFEPEIRYADLHRYREHEDLLRNVTDNEAEGSPLHRGDATRNSTGNAGIVTKKASAKLSRTASDSRRGQEAEVLLRAQARVSQARVLIQANNAKKHQRQQQQRQSNAVRPLSTVTQKSAQNEKEVDILYSGRQLNRNSKFFQEEKKRR